MPTRRLGLFVGITAAVASCTTVLYEGDRLPSSQVAVVSVENTRIDAMDGSSGEDSRFAKYEILPGIHRVEFRFDMTDPGMFQTTYVRSHGSIPVCFSALAGHRYVAAGRLSQSGTWSPEILEEETTRSVSTWRPNPNGGCRREAGGGRAQQP